LSSAQRTDAEMDMDKVKAVAEAIQNGTFKVNPEAIADKLLANAQEMLQGRMH
jgi:negative regulator of flagellin synthesis FlgM